MPRPNNPNCVYYVVLQDAERRMLEASLRESTTIGEAATRLGISVTWFRTRCAALGVPVIMTAATAHLIDNKPDPRPPVAPKPREYQRTPAQLEAARKNLEQSSRWQAAEAKRAAREDRSASEVVVSGDDAAVMSEDETLDWEPED